VSQSSVVTLVRSEFKKISSTRLWWGLLLGAVAWTLLWAVLSAAFAGVDPGGGQETSPPLDTPEAIRSVYGAAAFTGAYIFALILGIAGMTGEYRYQTITPTFLVSPRRTGVVGAKMIAHLVMGVVFGVVGVLTAVAAGGATILIRGFELGLGLDGVWASIGLTVVAVAIWTLVGIGIGTLIRNQIAAILIAVFITFLVEPLLSFALNAAELGSVAKFMPTSASTALLSPAEVGFDYLVWWQGGIVLLGYALLFAGLGMLLSLRRDVS
jgi:ABC-type transport system involved in multi-copper enzyme maturation permease subunit